MEKLKSYLEQNKLSQAKFGQQVGVSQSTVNRYLRGLRFPEPEVVLKIEEATGGVVRPVDWYAHLYPSSSEADMMPFSTKTLKQQHQQPGRVYDREV
ncbi:putative transcriptional regulator [Bartonella australis AUST/NH1]|uniref:Putative transcriptional regulator n=1 Tax=Bartonella australis (strain Aust/NH1) TaxID=1094489 RepID=M1NXC1_BARAA|nr:helix-turn-helix transcriptional regulator [Bartonella australis]AGF74117.1 putative transcriptional regulator [Bartonella australis AUST/NH1]